MATKISIIGAGSGMFALALIRDLCLTKSLAGSTVSFMDIDSDRLHASARLCTRYAAELGFNLTIEETLDQRESLTGAEFVVIVALAAGYDRLQEGWEIARRHGYGWAGSLHIMHDEAFWINFYQLRLFESVIQDALEICPQAYCLLVANPVLTGITHLARKYPQARVVGLCHGYGEVYAITNALGLDRRDIDFEIAGVNHFVWLTACTSQGRNVLPLIDRWLAEESEAQWAAGKPGVVNRKTAAVYQRLGMLPIGDTASWCGGSWPWYSYRDQAGDASWGEHPNKGWDRYFGLVKTRAAELARVAADPAVKLLTVYPPTHSGEPMLPIIESITGNIPRVIVGNVLNTREFVPGIPRDFEVELPILFSGRGLQPLPTKHLTAPVLAHLLRDRVAPVTIEVEAYRTGSQELLRQLILMDPASRSTKQAGAFLQEILAMPSHAAMRLHYQ